MSHPPSPPSPPPTPPPAPPAASPLSKGGELLLTTFGLGRLRPAPGTWGSMPPIALGVALFAAGLAPNETLVNWVIWNGVFAAVLLIFAVACVRFGHAAEARFGRKDPGQICADETAGMALTLLFLPARGLASPETAAATLLLAFLAFRALDIVKPWPAGRLQSVPGGWGVLLDDLAAGLQAWIVVQIVTRLAL